MRSDIHTDMTQNANQAESSYCSLSLYEVAYALCAPLPRRAIRPGLQLGGATTGNYKQLHAETISTDHDLGPAALLAIV